MCYVQTAEFCTLYERHSLALLALFSYISNKIDPFFMVRTGSPAPVSHNY